jgi:hypothetical protein
MRIPRKEFPKKVGVGLNHSAVAFCASLKYCDYKNINKSLTLGAKFGAIRNQNCKQTGQPSTSRGEAVRPY